MRGHVSNKSLYAGLPATLFTGAGLHFIKILNKPGRLLPAITHQQGGLSR